MGRSVQTLPSAAPEHATAEPAARKRWCAKEITTSAALAQIAAATCAIAERAVREMLACQAPNAIPIPSAAVAVVMFLTRFVIKVGREGVQVLGWGGYCLIQQELEGLEAG